ncbi:MAG: PKD domain-containing protein [Bacteroidota bacterium]
MKQKPGNNNLLPGILILSLFFFFMNPGKAQLSLSGKPYIDQHSTELKALSQKILDRPFLPGLDREDSANDKAGQPYRCAVSMKTNYTLNNSGQWEILNDGSKLWRLSLRSPGALALACYFEEFQLPTGAKLFIYNPAHTQILGAYSSDNNQSDRLFATELIAGDEIILEYHEPKGNMQSAQLSLGELAYVYRGVHSFSKSGFDFGGSASCEVNVNCDEGNDWKDPKQGVIRIFIKIGASSYWCTGTLVNNTLNDFKPYVLTADHCGQQATAANLSQWIFYFNYESADCANPLTEPVHYTMTGAIKKASSGYPGGVTGSDFYLVLLKNKVPESFNPYFNGWTRENISSSNGVTIHHPEGDIKKISTYTTPLTSTSWTSIPYTHWGVQWTATTNGYGVTEGGSSGSPLFDSQHLLMGQLSGGGASCPDPTQQDSYGKFSYSWKIAGSDSTGQLACWLDPIGSDPLLWMGLKPNITYVKANFRANRDTIIVGNTVNFFDLSTGNPDHWTWTFKGGNPYQSTDQNPTDILYNKAGVFDVSLKASNASTSQTMIKHYYITVIPNIYPNPFTDKLFIDMGDNTIEDFTVEAFDVLGRPVNMYMDEINPKHLYSLYLKEAVNGMIYLRIKAPGLDLSRKVLFIKKP